MRCTKSVYLSCLLFISLSNCAQAENNIGVSARLQYFNYEEFDINGTSLNQETGFIPGFGITLNEGSHTFAFEYLDGTVDYDGQTQAGSPHKTDTEQTIYKFSYRLSIPATNVDEQAYYYLGIEYQNWERDILPNNNVNGLYEVYRWWTASIGVNSAIYSDANKHLYLDIGLTHNFAGDIEIDLVDFGFGEPVLDLENKPGFQASLEYSEEYSENQIMTLGIKYTYSEFGRSDPVTLSDGFTTITIFEPDSKSNHVTLYLELSQTF